MNWEVFITQLPDGRWEGEVKSNPAEESEPPVILVYRDTDLWKVCDEAKDAIQADAPKETK